MYSDINILIHNCILQIVSVSSLSHLLQGTWSKMIIIFLTKPATALLKAERNEITWGYCVPDFSKCQHTCLANRRCVTDPPHTYLSQHFIAFSFLILGSLILAPRVQIQLLPALKGRKVLLLSASPKQSQPSAWTWTLRYPFRIQYFHEPFSNVPFFSLMPVKWVGPQRHVQVQRGEVRGLVHVRQQLVHVHVRWVVHTSACKPCR